MFDGAVWGMAGDGVVAILLVVTIVYVARLNNRLNALRADRGALAEMITGLQVASRQAEEAVAGLRISAAESGRGIADMIERGTALRDDLNFLIGRAEAQADRLEGNTRGRKDTAAPLKPPIEEPRASQSRIQSLLRQASAEDRPEQSIATKPETGASPKMPSPDARREQPRQSRSERDLQRALLGRR